MTTTTAPSLDAEIRIRSPWQEARRRFLKDRFAVFFLALLAFFFLLATAAQVIELRGTAEYDVSLRQMELRTVSGEIFEETAQPPTLAAFPYAILGTDYLGRSVLLRVFHGTKVAFIVGFWGALLSAFVGMTLGLVAGFLGRWVDEVVVYLYSTLASIPYLLLMLALAFIFRQGPIAEWYHGLWISKKLSLGLFNIILVIGLTYWVTLCRLVRAEVLKVRELDYVNAARSLGFGNLRIMFKHVLPNVFHLVIISFSLTFVIAIKSEVILTFLGVGVTQEPSWGQMITIAKNELMKGIWWPLAAAGTLLFLLTLAVNYVGDALRDALDPKLKV